MASKEKLFTVRSSCVPGDLKWVTVPNYPEETVDCPVEGETAAWTVPAFH